MVPSLLVRCEHSGLVWRVCAELAVCSITKHLHSLCDDSPGQTGGQQRVNSRCRGYKVLILSKSDLLSSWASYVVRDRASAVAWQQLLFVQDW